MEENLEDILQDKPRQGLHYSECLVMALERPETQQMLKEWAVALEVTAYHMGGNRCNDYWW